MTNDQYHDNAISGLLVAAVIGGAASVNMMAYAALGGILLLFLYRFARYMAEV